MIEMTWRFLRQRFGSVATVLALLLLALLACLPLNGGQGFASTDTLAGLVLAAGAISRDASSGALQMILSRPIRRIDYLAGRYLGFLLALAGFLAVSIALAAATHALVDRHTLHPGGDPFALTEAAIAALHAFLATALLGAAIFLFSTFLRGWGDILAVVLSFVLLSSLHSLGGLLSWAALSGFGQFAQSNLAPSVAWEDMLRGARIPWEPLSRYFLALVLYATLAAWIFCRREFSYGQD